MHESRSTLRYPIDLPARLHVSDGAAGADLDCRIRNLSLGGVFVVGPLVKIGTRARLVFRAPHLDRFDPWCVSRWHTASGTGLQFEGLRAFETYALARFIRDASRPTTQLSPDAVLRPPAG